MRQRKIRDEIQALTVDLNNIKHLLKIINADNDVNLKYYF